MSLILVVDDEPSILSSLDRALGQSGHTVLTARSGQDAVRLGGKHSPDLVLMDVQMEGRSGLDTLPELKQVVPGAPVILMTGHGTTDTAIEAMKRGAFDYLTKPLHMADLHALIAKAMATIGLSRPARDHGPHAPPAAGMVGRSPQMIEVCKTIGQAARSDVTVLIRGESGTGKELVARALHGFSNRAGQPFVTVNCAAIPETLLESELFGYEKGAFTGAVARRPGRFEQANRGTIFLDEIGDMSPGTQAKVLRILQDRTCERLGGSETLRLDVRVLAATNRDLERLVTSGVFREDLYYRLKVLSIHLPPLRERKQDIPELAAWFLRTVARDGGHVPSLSSAAAERLASHDWPGNVRELESCLKQAAVVCGNGVILPEHLRLQAAAGDAAAQIHDRAQEALRRMSRHALAEAPGRAFDHLIQEAERQVIGEALRRTQGNLVRAARLLGISRPTLRLKVGRYGLRRFPVDDRDSRAPGETVPGHADSN